MMSSSDSDDKRNSYGEFPFYGIWILGLMRDGLLVLHGSKMGDNDADYSIL